ncbi:U3 small nucleolar RNA-associated protein 14-like [Zingiber officinale]|uniref:Uncharacterized protein n=1 Tax=Zingiber officinale TaxID=94328 RepID=A0A8J5CBF6_ZINOF|nr:U3 small nucleolar RNA-associated protein 14-like [Zingiber officinale]KAG6471777.1 hypothetical protein ZIOFF_069223 [Zingiber officinale]
MTGKNTKQIPKGTKKGGRDKKKRHGPRLPSAVRKELEHLNADPNLEQSELEKDEFGEDVYEYDEETPEEETRKNHRYDSVDNYEYELPKEFEDEDVPSEDEELDSEPSEKSDDDQENSRHPRMLEDITGLPSMAFDGHQKKQIVVTDFQGDLNGKKISIHDLLDPLQQEPGYKNLRKKLHKIETKPMTVQVPLPKEEREKLERKVVYYHTRKDMTKWEPLVKRNREAPTLHFDADVNLGFSTVEAIASEFEPRTEFEKKMALLVRDPEIVDAYNKDGARLLELNKINIEDVKEHQHRLAKMRSLLFNHEMKSKRIKKIKSKTYHRILKKERLKVASAMEMDPEVAKENARKQEFKRAEERMTLKHKNRSKWAQRILKRGLDIQDEGTRSAITEQLHQHALLTRKMNSIEDNSDDDDNSTDDNDNDDSDELLSEKGKKNVSKLLNKAKESTLKALEDASVLPKSGVFALPFMERGLKKQQDAVEEEARMALDEYDASLRQHEKGHDIKNPKSAKVSGRKVFGPLKDKLQKSHKRTKTFNDDHNSDSEGGSDTIDHADVDEEVNNPAQNANLGPASDDDSENATHSIFKSFDDIVKEPGPKTTFEVAIFASDSWKKINGENVVDAGSTKAAAIQNSQMLTHLPEPEDMDQDSDGDSEEKMVDGFLSSSPKRDYELPSQADLVHQAFAGDDVEAEFEKYKLEHLNEECPEPEKPELIPGWGQWTDIQQKRGMPSWMINEHKNAKRKREEALKKRKDASLKNVIISENVDKKAEKLLAKTLPFPYTSEEVYEQSIRMPIGPDFNPAITAGTLNRPTVVKKPGVIIKPIQYEEVDPNDDPDQPRRIVQKPKAQPKANKDNSARGKLKKMTSTKKKTKP